MNLNARQIAVLDVLRDGRARTAKEIQAATGIPRHFVGIALRSLHCVLRIPSPPASRYRATGGSLWMLDPCLPHPVTTPAARPQQPEPPEPE